MRRAVVIAALVLAGAACGEAGDSPAVTTTAASAGCADVVGAEATRASDGRVTFRVTVRSADEGWDKYADAWEVRDADGNVLATRVLTHPHVDEQPFTRSLAGVTVPAGTAVTIAARDSVAGFCGKTLEVAVP